MIKKYTCWSVDCRVVVFQGMDSMPMNCCPDCHKLGTLLIESKESDGGPKTD